MTPKKTLELFDKLMRQVAYMESALNAVRQSSPGTTTHMKQYQRYEKYVVNINELSALVRSELTQACVQAPPKKPV